MENMTKRICPACGGQVGRCRLWPLRRLRAPRLPRKMRTLLRRGRHAHRESRPRHHPATTAAPPVNPMLHHLQRAGRWKVEQPASHPTRTPYTPGSTPGHDSPYDPGAPHAAASPPCGLPGPPVCAPSSPSGSASDARPPACGCCGSSIQAGAPTPLSAPRRGRGADGGNRPPPAWPARGGAGRRADSLMPGTTAAYMACAWRP